MKHSATDIMQEILFSAIAEGVAALKAASKGMPNALLRDLNALGPNTAFADLPKELQASIQAEVRSAFNRLLKEGYSITPTGSAPPPPRRAPGTDRPRSEGPRPGGRPGAGARPERPRGPRPDRPRGPQR